MALTDAGTMLTPASTDAPPDDDEFFDADDNQNLLRPAVLACGDMVSSGEAVTLEAALSDCMTAVECFFHNKFNTAVDLLRPWRKCSVYHAMGFGTMTYLRAIMTFDPSDIAEASKVLRESLDVCNKARRVASLPESVTKMIMKTNYKDHSDLECHAELCYAECLLLQAVLNILEDESFLSLIKGGLKIKTCFSCYRECLRMLKSRDWKSSTTRPHFEGGVKLGTGAFNLLISQLPARILQILEFVGLSGNKESGLRDLETCLGVRDNIHCSLASLALLAYHLLACTVMGRVSRPALDHCDQVLRRELAVYPCSALFLFFAGRLQLVECRLAEAEALYTRSRLVQNTWPQLGHICYWELFWCRLLQRDWQSAADYADCLIRESRWSRTVYSYMRAACLLMIQRSHQLAPAAPAASAADTSGSAARQQEIGTLMSTLPSYKQRIAGKSLSMEKLVIAKAQVFTAATAAEGGETAPPSRAPVLAVPGYELMYLWNFFSIVEKQRAIIEAIFIDIELEMKLLDIDTGGDVSEPSVSDDSVSVCSVECRALLLLLHGVCLALLDSPLRAEESLLRVTRLEARLRRDCYLVPFAWLELALLRCGQQGGRSAETTRLLHHAKNNYRRYPMENRLHFRVHYALSTIDSLK